MMECSLEEEQQQQQQAEVNRAPPCKKDLAQEDCARVSTTAHTTTTSSVSYTHAANTGSKTMVNSNINSNSNSRLRRRRTHNNFGNSKNQCLGKRDKSSAGRLDAGVVDLCAAINAVDRWYTTSSCAGRCFLYTGHSTANKTGDFSRTRVSHDGIAHPDRYFDPGTLVANTDPTGGGDPVALFDGGRRRRQLEKEQHGNINEMSVEENEEEDDNWHEDEAETDHYDSFNGSNQLPNDSGSIVDPETTRPGPDTNSTDTTVATDNTDSAAAVWWLRYEPLILHVACRSLSAAAALMAAARPTFKNVGLTAFQQKDDHFSSSKYLVAIWGDEGLDMPITTEFGTSMVTTRSTAEPVPTASSTSVASANATIESHSNPQDHQQQQQLEGLSSTWLAQLVNQRHERNALKISRFVQAVRQMPHSNESDEENDDDDDYDYDNTNGMGHDPESTAGQRGEAKVPRSYDVIGDVALIHSLSTEDLNEQNAIGEAILQRNKSIKIVALRQSNLGGSERAPGSTGLVVLAGCTTRNPLITTHREYGISCVVDINHTFFSPRMGPERLRLCQQTARGEHVLVLFAGVGMEALQIASRTEAATVTAIELNDIAVDCARKGHKLLERNKQGVKCTGAVERLEIIHGDCLTVLPTLPRNHYHRVLAPRPKEGDLDGDQPTHNNVQDCSNLDDGAASGGADFLRALLLVLKRDGGECHWYDFCADHEFPECERTRLFLTKICNEQGLAMTVLHVANVGSVAKRQLRVCMDFRIQPSTR